jgi:ribosomal protein L11 methyltransferase
MGWQQISLDIPRDRADATEGALEAFGALSVTFADAGDEPIVEPGPGETPLWAGVRVTALFEADTDLAGLREQLHRSLGSEPPAIEVTPLADQAWERAWLDDFQPLCFGDDLWIVPTGFEPPDPDGVNLQFDPGLAFGTGTHPTTALCLAWLAANPPVGQRVIDYGCGSGVLAVAALRLGAVEAVGIDNDPQALVASEANAARNGVSEQLALRSTEAALPAPAPLVMANIVSGVLIDNAPRLSGLVEPGGRLILSGVLGHQEAAVTAAFGPAFRFQRQEGEQGWLRLDGQAV